MTTPQIERWTGEFGRAYTDRNTLSPDELDELYVKRYGISRTDLNRRFLAEIPRNAKILEVGCNVGNQLLLLERMGFTNLHGIEIQEYAIERATARLPSAKLSEASAFEIPFPDSYFDVVFTSGVLIHIAPEDLQRAIAEMLRCTSAYVWGLEYYADKPTPVEYRGNQRMLWKMNYADLFVNHPNNLEPVKSEHLRYLDDPNVDSMFLVRKKRTQTNSQR